MRVHSIRALLYFKDQWLERLTKSNTFKAKCSIRIVHMYIYSYIVSVSVKQLYISKIYTMCLSINKQLNLN